MSQFEDHSEPSEVQSAVRDNNRRLRRINHILRQRVQTGRAYSDELFQQLCASDNTPDQTAEQAMREIWEKGGFQPPCGPDDYDEIVNTCIRALTAYREVAYEPASRDPEAAE